MCSDVLIIELECKHCKLRFNICRKCYCGHLYCSSSCRRKAQLKARRKVQSRYRTSDKGRATHRCYEKMQRMSKTNKTMADPSTNIKQSYINWANSDKLVSYKLRPLIINIFNNVANVFICTNMKEKNFPTEVGYWKLG